MPRRAGFTLLELLLVLAVLALATTLVAAAIRDPLATAVLRDTARLHAELLELRAAARSGGAVRALAARERLVLEGPDGTMLDRILFFPDGRATPAKVTLAGPDREPGFDIHPTSKIVPRGGP